MNKEASAVGALGLFWAMLDRLPRQESRTISPVAAACFTRVFGHADWRRVDQTVRTGDDSGNFSRRCDGNTIATETRREAFGHRYRGGPAMSTENRRQKSEDGNLYPPKPRTPNSERQTGIADCGFANDEGS